MTESTPITLTRRVESLRQEAAECLLWLAENCGIVMVGMDRIVVDMNGEIKGCEWNIAEFDERQRCEAIIALKNEVH